MRELIAAFVRHLEPSRSPRTTATYERILKAFAEFLESRKTETSDRSPPRRVDLELFLARPRLDGARGSPSSRNQELAVLRALSVFAMREGTWTSNPTAGISFLPEPPRDPPVLSVHELRRLFVVAAESSSFRLRTRNVAVLVVLSQAGLRVHELVALDAGQVDLESETLVGVAGKGGTLHDLPLSTPATSILGSWLEEREKMALPTEPALFVSSKGSRLSVRAVQHLLVCLRERLGTAKRITPHTLRHTTATLALTLGSDLSTVGELLRHGDLNTTRRYLHLVDERRREAVRRLAASIPRDLLATDNTASLKDFSEGRTAPSDPPCVQGGFDDVDEAA